MYRCIYVNLYNISNLRIMMIKDRYSSSALDFFFCINRIFFLYIFFCLRYFYIFSIKSKTLMRIEWSLPTSKFCERITDEIEKFSTNVKVVRNRNEKEREKKPTYSAPKILRCQRHSKWRTKIFPKRKSKMKKKNWFKFKEKCYHY